MLAKSNTLYDVLFIVRACLFFVFSDYAAYDMYLPAVVINDQGDSETASPPFIDLGEHTFLKNLYLLYRKRL